MSEITAEESFQAFLVQMRAATDRFYAGDAEPYKAIYSHRDDATRFGGWGGYEQGWEQLSARYDKTTANFRGGQLEYQALATHVSETLACTVGIERGQVWLVGEAEPETLASRVTHVYRREGDTWRLVHRHADPLVDTRRE